MNNEITPIKTSQLTAKDMVGYDVIQTEQKEVVEVTTKEVETGIEKVRPENPEINIRSLPILEALSKATSRLIKPLRLRSNDRLELRLNDDGERFVARVFAVRASAPVSDGKIQTNEEYFGPASYHAREFFDRIPEHQWFGSERCVLAGTDMTALVIYNSWPENQIIFKDEESRILYEFLIARFMVQTKNAVDQAKFKINREVPPLPEDFVEHPDPNLKLADYQLAALAITLSTDEYCLWFKQGLGKTPVAIHKMVTEAKRVRRKENRMMRCLIVCPKQLRKNWELEIGRFTTVPGKVVQLRGGEIKRTQKLIDVVRDEDDCVFSAAISSYESVVLTWKGLSQIPWDLVIIDEAQFIKNPNSRRSKACVKKLKHNARQKLELTGTPYGNHQLDLFPQFEFLGDGMSGFLSAKKFKSFHSKNVKDAPWEDTLEQSDIPLLKERIARVAFTLTKDEAGVKLPDKVRDIYEVTFTPQQAKLYKRIQNELKIEINDTITGEIKEITAEHILTKLLRLAQVTSGHIKYNEVWDEEGNLVSESSLEQIEGGNPKVDATVELIKQNMESDPKGKTVVWAIFDEDIRAVSERLHKEGIKHTGYKKQIVKEYRESGADESEIIFNTVEDCKVFIGHPASGGTGLNLVGWNYRDPENSPDTYCNREIFFSKNWSMLQRSQAEDRCAERRSSKCNVRITDLQVPDTIDDTLLSVVFGKMKASDDLKDLKPILSKVLDTEALIEED